MTRTLRKSPAAIRVVMFGGGPELTNDAKKFLVRLEEQPEIELLGAFCQSTSQSTAAIISDLWRRRGLLAIPLFSIWLAKQIWQKLLRRGSELSVASKLKAFEDRIHYVSDIHDEEVLDQVKSLEPDLGLVYGSPILRPELFDIPRLGTLGIHHGTLPEYRGVKTTFWEILNGEPTAGVTIQKINKGLDTGSIVKKAAVPVGRRTYGEVWRELEELGLSVYIKAILEVSRGTATYSPQIGPKGKLYRNPKFSDFLQLWAKQVKDKLRRT